MRLRGELRGVLAALDQFHTETLAEVGLIADCHELLLGSTDVFHRRQRYNEQDPALIDDFHLLPRAFL